MLKPKAGAPQEGRLPIARAARTDVRRWLASAFVMTAVAAVGTATENRSKPLPSSPLVLDRSDDCRASELESIDGKAKSRPVAWPAAQFPAVVRIARTTFLMGSPVQAKGNAAYRECEKPQHKVTVDSFFLGKFPITAEEYCFFLNECEQPDECLSKLPQLRPGSIYWSGTCFVPQPGGARSPAFPVTWMGAKRYCDYLSARSGRKVRLPTEAEWECAARGPELRAWPWGEDGPGSYHEVSLPFFSHHGEYWTPIGFDIKSPWDKSPVGSYAKGATPDGVYDLMGYLPGQWCADRFEWDAYKPVEARAPRGEKTKERVVRGRPVVQIDHTTFRPNPLVTLYRPYGGGKGKWARVVEC